MTRICCAVSLLPRIWSSCLTAGCSEGRTRHAAPLASPLSGTEASAQPHSWATAHRACRKDFCSAGDEAAASQKAASCHPQALGVLENHPLVVPSSPPSPLLLRACSGSAPLSFPPQWSLSASPQRRFQLVQPPRFYNKNLQHLFLERWGRQERKRSTKPAARDPSRSCHLHSPQPQELWVI